MVCTVYTSCIYCFVIPVIFGYVIVAVMLLFVGDVVDSVIVGFVMFIVVIAFVPDIAYPFPAASFTWVLT